MSGRDDPLGRRSLFSSPDEAVDAADVPAPSGAMQGRRALFSAPELRRSVTVVCRRCRARTPLSLLDITRRLVPSLWLPLRAWSRWLRCPSCGAFSWCRVEWGHLIDGG